MRRLASLIAIFILLATAAPLMACMTGSAMDQRESACCQAMHGNCGDMAAMGCCRTAVQTDEHPQLASTAPSVQLHLVAVDWLPHVLARTELAQTDAAQPALRQPPAEHSPPGLLIARLSVLRI